MHFRRKLFFNFRLRTLSKFIVILILTCFMLFSIYVTNRNKNHLDLIAIEGTGTDLYDFGVNVVVFKNVFIDPSKVVGAIGGEDPMKVANQPESYELLEFQYGFIKTSVKPNIKKEQLRSYETNVITFLKSVEVLDSMNLDTTNIYKEKIVFLITRVEYANLYHTMTDWYNTYLTMKLLNLSINNIHLLITDGHPIGNLDEVWYQLFNYSISRIGAYRQITNYIHHNNTNLLPILPMNKNYLLHIHKLVIIPYGYSSPLYVDKPLLSNMYIEEFRQFLLQSYHYNMNDNLCYKHIVTNYQLPQIIIISRRNYIAHPRNINGHISRKINNELQLLNQLKQLGFTNSLIIDFINLTISEQLNLIINTDILIGMHGAGLTYSLLLSNTSMLIELFPNYCCINNQHFIKFTKLRHIDYYAYYGLSINDNKQLESTYIPIDDFQTIILQTYKKWKENCMKINEKNKQTKSR
ncbi:unnamed protein product [Schistosoma curassoni]|nr:unnamed protein product [Schistosoma curassoni]